MKPIHTPDRDPNGIRRLRLWERARGIGMRARCPKQHLRVNWRLNSRSSATDSTDSLSAPCSRDTMRGPEQKGMARALLEHQRREKNPKNPALHAKQLRALEILAGLKKPFAPPSSKTPPDSTD
jgi:hypothetical protein